MNTIFKLWDKYNKQFLPFKEYFPFIKDNFQFDESFFIVNLCHNCFHYLKYLFVLKKNLEYL